MKNMLIGGLAILLLVVSALFISMQMRQGNPITESEDLSAAGFEENARCAEQRSRIAVEVVANNHSNKLEEIFYAPSLKSCAYVVTNHIDDSWYATRYVVDYRSGVGATPLHSCSYIDEAYVRTMLADADVRNNGSRETLEKFLDEDRKSIMYKSGSCDSLNSYIERLKSNS